MPEVFHDIRSGNRIFLCINAPAGVEAGRGAYAVERELDPTNCTPQAVMALIAEMAAESGLALQPSTILRQELGL